MGPHEYFNNNADYKFFKKHKTAQAVRPSRNKRIRANDEEAIMDIRNLSCANGEMKDHLDSLIKDVILDEYCKLTWSANYFPLCKAIKQKNK